MRSSCLEFKYQSRKWPAGLRTLDSSECGRVEIIENSYDNFEPKTFSNWSEVGKIFHVRMVFFGLRRMAPVEVGKLF